MPFILNKYAALVWMLIGCWLQDVEYRAPVLWWAFAAADVTASALALLTMCVQGIRTAQADPVKSLRSE